jgi:hypothetical protein
MSCLGTTTNNRPVGAGYNAQGNAISLVELPNISVSSVQTETISPLGSTVLVLGSLSAVTYLGVTATGGDGSPSGANNTIQFNNGGVFSGIPNGTYNPSTGETTISKLNSTTANITTLTVTSLNGVGLNELNDTTITSPAIGQILVHNGSEWINIASGSIGFSVTSHTHSLSSLTDTNVATPTAGQVLGWNNATLRWVASSVINSLSAESDVTITSPTVGQALCWNSASLRWVNSSIINSLSGDGDTAIVTPALGNYLAWNNTTLKWVASAVPNSLSGSTDVSITTPTAGQLLVWNSSTQRWNNSSVTAFQPLDATLTTMAGVTTTTNSLIFFSGVDTAGRINFTNIGRAFASSTASLAAQDLFYADSPNSVTTFNGPGNAAAVFVSKSDGTFRWLLPSNPGDILTYNGSDLEWSPP